MKKILSILAVLIVANTSFAQQNDTLVNGVAKNERTMVHSSMSFGRDFCGNNFAVSNFGVDYSRKINPKTTLYVGANFFHINTTDNLIDRAPRNKNAGAMYVGASYEVSKNCIIGGDLFYNGLYNAIGGDFAFRYNFSQDSFFEFSATFARQLSPTGYHYPIPYGYNDVFHPFVLGY